MLTEKQKEEILRAIDRGAWKYSWHLKLNLWGSIDFLSEENISKIVDVLHDEAEYGQMVAERANRLLLLLSNTASTGPAESGRQQSGSCIISNRSLRNK